MSDVIVDEVKFYFKYEGADVYVHAYAQDIEESDQYTIKIGSYELDYATTLYFDSCGNTTEDIDMNDKIIKEVIDILFVKREHGIIRSF